MTTSLYSTMNAYAHGYRSERNQTVTTDADYAVGLLKDGLEENVLVTDTGVPRTITIPDALQSPIGYCIQVKDVSGGAGVGTITVLAAVAGQIEGGDFVEITDDFGSRKLVCTGTGWAVIETSAGTGGGGGGGGGPAVTIVAKGTVTAVAFGNTVVPLPSRAPSDVWWVALGVPFSWSTPGNTAGWVMSGGDPQLTVSLYNDGASPDWTLKFANNNGSNVDVDWAVLSVNIA